MEADVYVWHYAPLLVHVRKEEENKPSYSDVSAFDNDFCCFLFAFCLTACNCKQ